MKKDTKEKIAYCGSLFLGTIGAISMAAGAASMAHTFTGMEFEKIETIGASLFAVATLFSAGARVLGEAKKPEWIKNSQGFIFGLAFCGASVLTGSDTTIVMQDDVRRFTSKVMSTTPPQKDDSAYTINFSDYYGKLSGGNPDDQNPNSVVSGLCSCAENYQTPSNGEQNGKSSIDFVKVIDGQNVHAS